MKHIVTQNTETSIENTEKYKDGLRVARGDVVMARVASGKVVQRRVWSVSDAVVYLCSEQLYKDLLIGASRLLPIGFPKADVQLVTAK